MQTELNLLSSLSNLISSPNTFEKKVSKYNKENKKKLSESVIEFREKTRSSLLTVQSNLSSNYSKKISDFILFPVIAVIDEKFKIFMNDFDSSISWESLQVEFFQRNDGGEYVFEITDDLLSNKIYPKICYESMLLVLQSDFLGKYYDNPNHSKRYNYIGRLKETLLLLNKDTIKKEDKSKQTKIKKSIPITAKTDRSKQFMTIIVSLAIIIPISIYLLA